MPPRHYLDSRGFLRDRDRAPGCIGACNGGRQPCHTPVSCGTAVAKRDVDLMVIRVAIGCAIALVVGLITGWM